MLLETEWALRSAYSLPRETILDAFRRLLGFAPLAVEDRGAVLRALRWYADGLDLADALHLASLAAGARFATFDRGLAQRAAPLDDAPPVDLL